MKILRALSIAAALLGAGAITNSVFAHEGHNKGQLVPVTEKDTAWVAKAKAEYPTTACVVSEDKLGGDMGKPVDFIYRVKGKSDRLISFCCKDCVKDFNKEPEKYLKVLDDAAAKKGDSMPEHQHKH
jgi:YHS domain-containing protein